MVVTPFEVRVDEVAGVNGDSADSDGAVEIHDMAPAVRTDHAVAERREVDAPDLVEIARGAAGDERDGAEGLVGRAHDLTEGGGDGGVVEVLEDDDGRAGQFREPGDMLIERAVDITVAAGEGATDGRGGGVTDGGRHFGKAGADARIHVAIVTGTEVEEFDGVAEGGGVELGEGVQVDRHELLF